MRNGQVVWAGYDDYNYNIEVFLYDGVQVKKISADDFENNVYNVSPQLHNGQITWQSSWYDATGSHYEISYYNGTQVVQLTNNDGVDFLPRIHNGQITWFGWFGSYGFHPEIFFYDGDQILHLTELDYYGTYPEIDNGQVTWTGVNGSSKSAEIFFYRGTLPPEQITHNNFNDVWPQIHDGQIVWQGWDGNDWEIFFYDGIQPPVQITDNNFDDLSPQIHNGQIIWSGWDGNDWEIFLDDGTHAPEQLTNNDFFDGGLDIHNGQLTWTGYDGQDYEIFLATPKNLEILDGVDFSVGTEVSGDPETLASGGEPVEGAVADGVTRLLLRLDVANPGAVTFTLEGTGDPDEDGILHQIDGSQAGNTLTVNSVATSEGEKIFVIYTAPENFVRADYKEQDEKVSERTISLKVSQPDNVLTETIRLVRPPLVLVHGLWSSSAMWDDFYIKLSNKSPNGLTIFVADYSLTNASHFEVNKDVVREKIEAARKDMLDIEKIAMVQADVMGHSMGGLLSRIHYQGDMWPDRTAYKQDTNYHMGDINKFISLDSVHFGSFLADFALNFKESLAPMLRNLFLSEMRDKKMPIDEGALDDLATLSPPIVYMNGIFTEPKPQCHAIAGDTAHVNLTIMPGYIGTFFEVIKFYEGDTTIPVAFPGQSDLVVSLESQAGGLASPALSVFDHPHTAATTQEVADKVVELLNKAFGNSSFEDGFPIHLYP